MEPVLAFLITADGPRQTCVGCSELLLEKGMLRVMMDRPFSEQQPEHAVRFYALADDFTMDDCRRLIRDRHIGPAWGS